MGGVCVCGKGGLTKVAQAGQNSCSGSIQSRSSSRTKTHSGLLGPWKRRLRCEREREIRVATLSASHSLSYTTEQDCRPTPQASEPTTFGREWKDSR